MCQESGSNLAEWLWLRASHQMLVKLLARAAALSRLHWGRICFHVNSRGCWRPQFLPMWASPVIAWCLHSVATGCSRVSDSRRGVGMHLYSICYMYQCWEDISQGCDYLGVGILGDHLQGWVSLMPHFFSKCPPTFPSWLKLNSVQEDVSTHRLWEWTYGCQGWGWGEGIVREFGIGLYMLLYFKWITNKGLPYSTWHLTQCYVAAWMRGDFGGEWIWIPSPFT